ncbi:phosphodiester glycosidase family protein, partial [Nocardioides massiliensis]
MPSSRRPLRRPLLALVCSAALVLTPGLAPAASADDQQGRRDAPRDAPYRYESGEPASGRFGTAGVKPDTRPGAAHFDVDEVTTPVARGLTHTRFDRLLPTGWIRANLLTADLGTPGLRLNYVGAPRVSSTEPLATMLRRHGAVAGVNGDFFDIGDTGAALGVGQQRGRGLLHAPASGWNNTFLLSGKQQARIATTFLDASVRRAGGQLLRVTNLNSPTIARDGIGIYTPAWGSDARSRVVPGQRARQVVIRDGRVRSNSLQLGTGEVPQGATVLIGVGKGAQRLSGWRRGNRVAVKYALDTSSRVAISGNTVILRKGTVLGGDPVRHPRTAIGIDATGQRVFVLTVDGRASHSTGVTLAETARILKEWGAVDALNLDGGGSSTMMARHAGTSIATMNHTSDGRQRAVPNGLGFRVVSGSTKLAGFHVRTAGTHPDDDRVLRGLGRTLAARGHTGRYGPSSARPTWRAGAGAQVRAGRSLRKVVVGRATGPVTVAARNGAARGTLALRVLGPVQRLEPTQGRIVLAGAGSGQYVELRGYDAAGHGTWVEPRDVQLAYNRNVLSVTPSGRGFLVRAKRGDARSPLTFTAGGVSSRIGVTSGDRGVRAHRLDGAGGWSTATARASASLAATSNRAGRAGRALQVTYRAAKADRRARHI